MKSLFFGILIGYWIHWSWVWWRHRVTFTTTSYTANSGKTQYVSYTFPKSVNLRKYWLFKSMKDVYARRSKRKAK